MAERNTSLGRRICSRLLLLWLIISGCLIGLREWVRFAKSTDELGLDLISWWQACVMGLWLAVGVYALGIVLEALVIRILVKKGDATL